MSWDDELRKIVIKKWTVGQVFALREVYRYEPYFSKLYPRNRHVREKLRQILQHLRDEGTIQFVDDEGTYRRIR